AAEYLRGLRLLGLSALVQLVLVYATATVALWLFARTLGVDTTIAAGIFLVSALVAAAVGVLLLILKTRPPASYSMWTVRTSDLMRAPYMLWTALALLGLGGVDVVILGYLAPGEETSLYVAAARTALVTS